jgi:hypothetical protein
MADQRHRLTWPEAQSLVEAELAGIRRYAERIEDLRSDPTFGWLSLRPLTGVTRRRWEAAHTALLFVESRHRKWQSAVAEAIELVAHHLARGVPDSAQDAADLGRVEQLLCDRGVLLAREEMLKVDRPAPGSISGEPRFSLSYVKSLIEDDLAEVLRLVREVAEVWDDRLPRIEQLTTDLNHSEPPVFPAAADMGHPAVAALHRRLGAARTAVETDPLAARAGGERVDRAYLDGLGAELEAIRQIRRRLLRERLEIYRRRARDGGSADRPELVTLYERARLLLRAVRAGTGDLDVAEQAVQAYAGEVWHLGGERGEQ